MGHPVLDRRAVRPHEPRVFGRPLDPEATGVELQVMPPAQQVEVPRLAASAFAVGHVVGALDPDRVVAPREATRVVASRAHRAIRFRGNVAIDGPRRVPARARSRPHAQGVVLTPVLRRQRRDRRARR
jgi:hypothetical protein